MRIMQSYMAVTGLLGKGIDPAEFAIWPKMVLIDDGAGLGHSAEEEELLDNISAECGLLLQAKDADTMLRGLRKIRQDQTVSGKTGLAVVAMQYTAGGGTSILKAVTKGAKVVAWGGHRGAQGVIHPSFDLLAFFHRVHYYKGAGKEKGQAGLTKAMGKLQQRLGRKSKLTWEEFRNNHIGDSLSRKCVMLMVCSTSAISNGKGDARGVIAIRNINESLSVAQLRAHAERAFKGISSGTGSDYVSNLHSGTQQPSGTGLPEWIRNGNSGTLHDI